MLAIDASSETETVLLTATRRFTGNRGITIESSELQRSLRTGKASCRRFSRPRQREDCDRSG